MNTKIEYMYRDAANYKAYPQKDVVVAGRVEDRLFDFALNPDRMFIPAELGLPELQPQLEGYPSNDDHIWHQLISIKKTTAAPTVDITAKEINNRLNKIKTTGWNESAAFKRHQLAGIWS